MKLKFVALIFLFITGCSNRVAYEGGRVSSRFECNKLQSPQYDECIDNVDKTFDDFERERKEALE